MNPWLNQLLSDTPLSSNELAKSSALRFCRCLRSSEGDFEKGPVSYIWVVISLTKRSNLDSRSFKKTPLCIAFSGNGRYLPSGIRPCKVTLLAQHELAIDNELWVVNEYSFSASVQEPRLAFFHNGQKLIIGRQLQNRAIAEYGRIISNASVDPKYPDWLNAQRSELATLPVPSNGPLMSIVTPAYKTPATFLRKMIQSVVEQTYPKWELVIVNASPDDNSMRAVFDEFRDSRIRVIDTPINEGIAGNTNLGLHYCNGDYVCFFDHDDTVEPNALAEYVRAIDREPDAGLIYCDEDNIDEKDKSSLPLLKPDYNESFLLSNNYIIHWLAIRRDLLSQIKLSDKSVEGAQDYDLTFKIAELGHPILHIPYVLYHWRIHSGSTAGNPAQKTYAQDAGAKAIRDHLTRISHRGTVERGEHFFTYRTINEMPSELPSISLNDEVSLSTLTRNSVNQYLEMGGSIASYEKSDIYLNIGPNCDFDFDSLQILIETASTQNVFSVSPRVIRQDGLFDYANSILTPEGAVINLLRYLPSQDGGYVGRSERPYDALLGNPQCCAINLKDNRGRFNPKMPYYSFTAAYKNGLRNVYMPYATATLNHPQSLIEPNQVLSEVERNALFSLFEETELFDPSHSPCFNPRDGYYKLRI